MLVFLARELIFHDWAQISTLWERFASNLFIIPHEFYGNDRINHVRTPIEPTTIDDQPIFMFFVLNLSPKWRCIIIFDFLIIHLQIAFAWRNRKIKAATDTFFPPLIAVINDSMQIRRPTSLNGLLKSAELLSMIGRFWRIEPYATWFLSRLWLGKKTCFSRKRNRINYKPKRTHSLFRHFWCMCVLRLCQNEWNMIKLNGLTAAQSWKKTRKCDPLEFSKCVFTPSHRTKKKRKRDKHGKLVSGVGKSERMSGFGSD